MTARLDAATTPDAEVAERAWTTGDHRTAIEAADRALAAGADPLSRAAGVAAAAATADAALRDATSRWRRIAETVPDAAGVEARGRAALISALLGDRDQAATDLATARGTVTDPAPRGLTVLLDGVDAVLGAVRGDLAMAADRLAGLAAATIPPDPFAVDPWHELAAAAATAAGDDVTARTLLAAQDGELSTRGKLFSAWLSLRTGRLPAARAELATATTAPVLRRNAVLAAVVSVGLARRGDDAVALASTWRRVAPVIAGADIELLHIDMWGEFSAVAAAVSPAAATTIAAAMDVAITRAGHPSWAVAAGMWWRVQRTAAAPDSIPIPIDIARFPTGTPYLNALAAGAQAWISVLGGQFDARHVLRATTLLVDAGRPWEGVVLAVAAAERATEAATARQLLSAVRGLRRRSSPEPGQGRDGLSAREREIGRMLLDGHTQREIGARLYISPKTVQQHVTRLRQKLVADNRAELVAALRARLAAERQPGLDSGTR